VEVGGWRFANHPPAEIQASLANHLCKSPQTPLFRKRGFLFGSPLPVGRQVRSLEKENFFFVKKKTTVFSLFLKREGEAGIKKIGCG